MFGDTLERFERETAAVPSCLYLYHNHDTYIIIKFIKFQRG